MNLLLVISWLWGNLYKFSFFSPDVHVSLLDITIFLVFIFSAKKLLKVYRPLLKSIIIFPTIGLISLIFGTFRFGLNAGVVGSFYLFRWIIYSVIFVALGSKIQISKLRLLGLGTVILGILQYFLYPDIRWLQISEWDPHYYRVVSTFLDPGFTGLIIVFTLILITLNPLKNRVLNLFIWFISYFTFAFTYSRSSYLAFLVSFAWISWHKKSWKLFLGVILLFVSTIYLLPRSPDGEGVKLERTSSIAARIANWKTAWRIFNQNPILGVGFNTYRYAQGASLKSHAGAGADSSLLFVAATTGIFGLIAYLLYLKNIYTLNPDAYILKATLVALLIHSLFLNSLFYPPVMLWIAILVANSNSPSQSAPS